MNARDEHVLEYLAKHDLPCARCGYNLRGLEKLTCPECGAAVTLPAERSRPATGKVEAYLFGFLGFLLVPVVLYEAMAGTGVQWIFNAVAAPLVMVLHLARPIGPFILIGIPFLWAFYGLAVGRCRRSRTWRSVLVVCAVIHAMCFIIAVM